MMNDADPGRPSDGEPWAPLVDVSRLPFAQLNAGVNAAADAALGVSLRRVLDSLHDRDGVISAFTSAVPEL